MHAFAQNITEESMEVSSQTQLNVIEVNISNLPTQTSLKTKSCEISKRKIIQDILHRTQERHKNIIAKKQNQKKSLKAHKALIYNSIKRNEMQPNLKEISSFKQKTIKDSRSQTVIDHATCSDEENYLLITELIRHEQIFKK
jgi:hypothetical protein